MKVIRIRIRKKIMSSSTVLSTPTYPVSVPCLYTHPFNGPFSGTTRVSRHQKDKTSFTEATDSEWQWHQLGHMQVCTLLQTDNHASTPPLKFFTGRMPFLPPNRQHQSTEGNMPCLHVSSISTYKHMSAKVN